MTASRRIRHLHAGLRPGAICWSERFVIPVITCGAGRRAGPGQDRATLGFPAERGRFRRPKEEGSARLSLDGHFDLPSSARFQSASTAAALT